MILAKNSIIPPNEWYHDPTIKNKENKSVASYLYYN